MNDTAVVVKQPEAWNIQDIFVIHDTLTLKQTDYYYPIRGPNSIEEYHDWTERTEEPHTKFDDKYSNHTLQVSFVVEEGADDPPDRRSGVLRFDRQVDHRLVVYDISEFVLCQVQSVVRVVLVHGITDSHDYYVTFFDVVYTV